MKILLLGPNGQVGAAISKLFRPQVLVPISKVECNLSMPDSIISSLNKFSGDIVINAAAYTAVDNAEENADLAFRINAEAPLQIARFCRMRGIPLIHFSTDYVFDGAKQTAYEESDQANPINIYGHSKLAGEINIMENLSEAIILRLSWIFGINGQNFVKRILELAVSNNQLNIVKDQTGCPTAAKDIARVVEIIVKSICNSPTCQQWGVYHYASQHATTWYDFAKAILAGSPNSMTQCVPILSEAYPTKASRPKNSVLATQKIQKVFGVQVHNWREYLPEVIASVV